MRALLGTLHGLSPEASFRTALTAVHGFAKLVPRWQHAARRNVEIAFPALDAIGKEALIEGCYQSLARLFSMLSRFPDLNAQNISSVIRYDGFEHFETAKRRGKGVLFATGHLGNWELSAFSHALMTEPMGVIIRPMDNPLLDALSERYRASSGNQILGRRDFLRPMMRLLQENRAVGILVDQNTTPDRGVFVNFFTKKACVDASFARLAARTGATVIPGFAVWNASEQRYVLKFYPPVEITGDELADTQAIQTTLENAIREYPDQWLWVHRRWKSRPPGEPSLY